MLIGAFGRFWERDYVDFESRNWRLLGRRGLQRGTIRIADFRKARGVYVLYNEVGVYYVGLATGDRGIGGRLKDHLTDDHNAGWNRFSWFSFDDVSDLPAADGIHGLQRYDSVEADTPVLIRDLEALLQVAMQPLANFNETKFTNGDEWLQVATQEPYIYTLDELAHRLG